MGIEEVHMSYTFKRPATRTRLMFERRLSAQNPFSPYLATRDSGTITLNENLLAAGLEHASHRLSVIC